MDLYDSTPELTLADILHECPRLLQLLTTNCVKSLLATSQGLRQLARGTVDVLSMSSAEFLKLNKVAWPNLRMVKLPIHESCPSVKSDWTLLATVCTQASSGPKDNILILKASPTHQALPEAASNQLDSHTCELLLQQDWSQTTFLTLECNQEASLAAALLRQLAQKPWSVLFALTVSCANLDVHGIAAIVKGDWARLSLLSITCAQLDDKAMQQLAAGEWPFLCKISLRGIPSFDTNVVSHLAAPNWKALQHVCLSSVHVRPAVKQQLVTIPLLQLVSLELSECCIGAQAMSKAGWPVLRELVLCANPMDATAMSHLALAKFPALCVLDLSQTGLEAVGTGHFPSADWPELQDLCLPSNPLNLQAIESLVKGQWTQLRSLHLTGTQLCAGSIKELTTGQWPDLTHLYVDIDFLDDSTAHILGLDMRQLLKELDNGLSRACCAKRPCWSAARGHAKTVFVSGCVAKAEKHTCLSYL